MSKLGLVIVDGVGYRNFVLSKFLNKAVNGFDEVVIYSGLRESVYDLSNYKNISIIELDIYRENRKAWFWRKLNETAHLYKHRSFFGMNDTLNFTKPKGTSKRDFINRFIRLIASVFHSEKNMKWYQKKVYKAFNKSDITQNFIKTLSIDKPDILFFTHQRPPYIAPLVYAANENNIKTCSFIFSWDNLSSKGRIPAMFSSFLVWSDLMKEELLYFYPSVNKNDIYIVGTPQFEPYVMEDYKTSKSNFYKNFNLDDSKKTICFSCGDLSTGRNDQLAISIIADAILDNKIKYSVNLLVRTSPADDGSRFDKIRRKYPFISWNKPKWVQTRENHAEPWSQRLPLRDDIKDLRSILEYSDLSINMCSTMSLDFMIFDKPVVNQVLGNIENGLFNDQRFLNYNHYKKVVESEAVVIAKTKEELIKAINNSLLNPDELRQQQEEILKLGISKPLEGTSERIVNTLLELS
ncbi:MAG: hypothetical protein L3J14_05205 [Flavobacteriaceae bacterium]|nr:hypothetical protein [Flavobacteriaceae bacterium]